MNADHTPLTPEPSPASPVTPSATPPVTPPVFTPPVFTPPVFTPPVVTLCVDIGGTGLKASVVDAAATMLTERVRVPTTYPMGPQELVERVSALVAPLPRYDRVSVGFPGVVRGGRILTAPHFVTTEGPGSPVDPGLTVRWRSFDLVAAFTTAFGCPTRVCNDADIQGLAAATGSGVEMVITLGTGVGTSILEDGVLGPHLELAHHPFRHDETYNEQIGDAARKRVGDAKWNRRVAKALSCLEALVLFDTCYIGGGNAERLDIELGPNVHLIDPNAGILGGIRLWDRPSPEPPSPHQER